VTIWRRVEVGAARLTASTMSDAGSGTSAMPASMTVLDSVTGWLLAKVAALMSFLWRFDTM